MDHSLIFELCLRALQNHHDPYSYTSSLDHDKDTNNTTTATTAAAPNRDDLMSLEDMCWDLALICGK